MLRGRWTWTWWPMPTWSARPSPWSCRTPGPTSGAFVMGPLAEVAPEWRHPVLGATAGELAAGAPVGRDAAPRR